MISFNQQLTHHPFTLNNNMFLPFKMRQLLRKRFTVFPIGGRVEIKTKTKIASVEMGTPIHSCVFGTVKVQLLLCLCIIIFKEVYGIKCHNLKILTDIDIVHCIFPLSCDFFL